MKKILTLIALLLTGMAAAAEGVPYTVDLTKATIVYAVSYTHLTLPTILLV